MFNIKRTHLLALGIALLVIRNISAQSVNLLHSGTGVSLRGLSVIDEKMVWVSGSGGTVGKSSDRGRSWTWIRVHGYEDREFRDIEAFDGHTAVIMAAGEPAVILKTNNGGISWNRVFFDDRAGMFLDAMEFWNRESGIVVGDPIDGRFFVARSFDGGDSWTSLESEHVPAAISGEACFAASGTNVRAFGRDAACFVSGGSVSRLFWRHDPVELPLRSGAATRGANSLAVWHHKRKPASIAIVGGDFSVPADREGNCVISRDTGKSWIKPSNPPFGYRSCVEYLTSTRLVTCGLNGVDVSLDEGINWNAVSETGFNVCRKAKKGRAVYLAGNDGRIARLVW